ncbi:hypothetical protein D3C85_1307530 [compost metagenome]
MLGGRLAHLVLGLALAEVVEHHGGVALVGHGQRAALTTDRCFIAGLVGAHEQQRTVAGQQVDAGLEAVAVLLGFGFADGKAVAQLRQHRDETQAVVALLVTLAAVQQAYCLHPTRRHDQPCRADHQAPLLQGQAVEGYFARGGATVIHQLDHADLDEGSGITAIAHALEQGALAFLQVIVEPADVQLRRCMGHARQQRQSQAEIAKWFHDRILIAESP